MVKPKRRTIEEMEKLVAKYEESGETIKSFSKKSGISVHTFQYWRNKINKFRQEENGFQRISITPVTKVGLITLRLPNRIEIELPYDYSAEAIGRMINVISC